LIQLKIFCDLQFLCIVLQTVMLSTPKVRNRDENLFHTCRPTLIHAVEMVTSETDIETWLKLRNRDRDSSFENLWSLMKMF